MELVYTLAPMAATIIPFELPLPKVLPTIEGNVDYRTLRDQLVQINQMLVISGLEDQMIEADLKQWLQGRSSVSAKAQQNRQLHSRRALRCNIARLLLTGHVFCIGIAPVGLHSTCHT